jgi:integrase
MEGPEVKKLKPGAVLIFTGTEEKMSVRKSSGGDLRLGGKGFITAPVTIDDATAWVESIQPHSVGDLVQFLVDFCSMEYPAAFREAEREMPDDYRPERYRSHCWADKAQTKKIKISTIHRELSIVKAILNWSTYKQQPPIIPYNPVDKYEMPRRDDEIILPPTKEERQRIYDKASPHIQRFIVLNYNTGARSGSSELLKICWEHVDIKANRITIISADKGGPKLRRIGITEELVGYLANWRQEDSQLQGCDPFLISGPRVHYRGTPIKKINKAWTATLKRAGIKRRIRPYDLRHAFATDLLEAGGDIGTVSRIMGHSRPDTTLKVSQHITGKQAAEVIDKLPSALKKRHENE